MRSNLLGISFIIVRIIAIILLLWAFDRHRYDYYILLRFVVCGVGIYGAYLARELQKAVWVWILAIIAILFNPFLKVHLERDTWAIIDSAVAIILFISLFVIRRQKLK